ncbi:MAG TPA: LPS export ABC transporter periplasmic protein LptC [Candidatus Parabacteroides intestinavium]|nr:LPS export ABC transporter periplasmic protein LptC [Candidatus Parabacteroides intestinavium]
MIQRFRGKTDILSITTTTSVVVMLLLFSVVLFSCKPEVKEVVEVSSDPEKSYTMKATQVNTLISDSGITRYRVKAKEWLVFGNAKEPHSYFPEGIYVEKFDTTFHTEASIKADTAYYFDKKGLWRLIGNVEVESLQGERFNTSELFWDQKAEKVYSDKYIRIQQKEQIITGIGFESNQNMTRYRIFNSQGEFPVEEEATPQTSADSVKAENMMMVDSLKKE